MKKRACIFPGQGVQYVGMGRDIYEKYPEARIIFERASDALNIDLKGLCFHGPEENLGLTTYTQPAILTTSLAIWACLGDIETLFLAGHSLGEFTAFVAGGALALETAVRLVSERGRYMQDAVPPDIGAMAAIIGLEKREIEEICSLATDSGKVWPANYNCPGQVVISGEKKGVMKAIELSKERGAKHSVLLPVSIPSHSPLMEGAAARFTETVKCIEIRDLEIPVISNFLAYPIKEREEIKKSMVQQLTSPVYWEEGIRFMLNAGVNTFIEVGPGKVLTGLIKRIDRDIETMNISDAVSVERIRERLS